MEIWYVLKIMIYKILISSQANINIDWLTNCLINTQGSSLVKSPNNLYTQSGDKTNRFQQLN